MAALEQRDEQAFLEYVQGGGQVETTDSLPDDYRAKQLKFIEIHGNSDLMGVLPEQFEHVQDALHRRWPPLMQFHGNPIPKDEDPMFQWRIKSQGNEEARQQFLEGYVPQIRELGLEIPDPKLRRRDDGVWEYSEPDWDELRHVVTGHGPKTEERLAFRRRFLEQERWVRDLVLAA